MPYGDFKQVTGTIAEREWCIGDTITTTAVTSCIVVVSKVGSELFGIHLSVFGTPDPFAPDDAEKVGQIMKSAGADMSNVHVFGEIEFWNSSIPGYTKLVSIIGWDWTRWHQKSGNITVSKADMG